MYGFVLTDIGAGGKERVDDPAPGSTDVIVQPAYSGLCGTDVHMFREGIFIIDYALTVLL